MPASQGSSPGPPDLDLAGDGGGGPATGQGTQQDTGGPELKAQRLDLPRVAGPALRALGDLEPPQRLRSPHRPLLPAGLPLRQGKSCVTGPGRPGPGGRGAPRAAPLPTYGCCRPQALLGQCPRGSGWGLGRPEPLIPPVWPHCSPGDEKGPCPGSHASRDRELTPAAPLSLCLQGASRSPPFPAAPGTQPPHNVWGQSRGKGRGGFQGCEPAARVTAKRARAGWGCRHWTVLHRPRGSWSQRASPGVPRARSVPAGPPPSGRAPSEISENSPGLAHGPCEPLCPALVTPVGTPDLSTALPTSHPWLPCCPHHPAVNPLWLPTGLLFGSAATG